MIDFAHQVKLITAPYLARPAIDGGLLDLDGLSGVYRIDHLLWSSPVIKPDVSFNIGYSDSAIFLKFSVTELHIKAEYHRINDPVYKDSCVEFFIGFGNDKQYYNLEFNRLGTPLGGFGSNRHDRNDLPVKALAAIKSQYDLHHSGKTGLYTWQLALMIPFSVFTRHQINDLRGEICRCNFLKCGDDLPDLHFMSWSPNPNPEPDFHLPQYFGAVKFAPAAQI